MHIQFSTVKPFIQPNITFAGNNNFQPRVDLQTKPDMFIKTSNVSFSGKSEKADSGMTVKDVLVGAGFVGVPLLLGIGVTSALAGNQSSEDIFLPDGTYFMSTRDFVESKIHANAETGELSIEGTPINIDPSKIQYADAAKGVYKSEDGNIDIDLLNNKYIDKENGIFIDPSRNISAMKIDGELHSVSIPNFGSGYPINPWDPDWAQHVPIAPAITRENFITQYEMTPEEYNALYGYLPQKILPNDDRNLAEKIRDYVAGRHDENTYDIFGNKVISFHDAHGNVTHVSIDEHLAEALKSHNIDDKTLANIAEFVNDMNLQRYISENVPEYASMVHIDSMDDFIAKLSSHHINAGEAGVHTDTDTDTDADLLDSGAPDAPEIPSGGSGLADWISELFEHLSNEA